MEICTAYRNNYPTVDVTVAGQDRGVKWAIGTRNAQVLVLVLRIDAR
jgi:hypothetical protein